MSVSGKVPAPRLGASFKHPETALGRGLPIRGGFAGQRGLRPPALNAQPLLPAKAIWLGNLSPRLSPGGVGDAGHEGRLPVFTSLLRLILLPPRREPAALRREVCAKLQPPLRRAVTSSCVGIRLPIGLRPSTVRAGRRWELSGPAGYRAEYRHNRLTATIAAPSRNDPPESLSPSVGSAHRR